MVDTSTEHGAQEHNGRPFPRRKTESSCERSEAVVKLTKHWRHKSAWLLWLLGRLNEKMSHPCRVLGEVVERERFKGSLRPVQRFENEFWS